MWFIFIVFLEKLENEQKKTFFRRLWIVFFSLSVLMSWFHYWQDIYTNGDHIVGKLWSEQALTSTPLLLWRINWQKVVVKGGKNMEVVWVWTSCSRHASGRNRQQGWRLTVGVRDEIIGVSPLCTAALFNWRLPKLLILKWKHWLSTEKKPSAPFFFFFQLEKCFHSSLCSHDFKACSFLFVKGLPHPLN